MGGAPAANWLPWSDDRIEQLKKLWESGLSAAQIANALGNVSRNAVIGKVHRLGLSGRVKASSGNTRRNHRVPGLKRVVHVQPRPSRVATALAAIEAEPPYVEPAEAVVIPFAQRKSLYELTVDDCRWPIGDPQTADFHFCGGRALTDLPYCAHHTRLAHDPRRGAKPGGAVTRRGASDAWV